MACAGLLLVSVMAAASANLPDALRSNSTSSGQPSPVAREIPSGPINLSVRGAIHAPAISPSGAEIALGTSGNDHWDGGGQTSINLGPLHTEFGGVTDHHMHVATVRLDGVSVLGSSISGSIDSRSARVTFTWRTSP
jgi:hypothetical protein